MRDSGATTVALMVALEAIGIVRDAKAIGYSPNWTGGYWTADETSAAGGQLFKGVKAVRHYATVNSPAYAEYVNKARADGKNVTNSSSLALYGMGLITGRVLQAVGKDPTAAALEPAIESLVNYDDGIWHLSFGKGVHVADIADWPVQCCNDDNTWHGTGPPMARF
jgi:ABC-type branched-subunit amino acid transport system substrate-binding protein